MILKTVELLLGLFVIQTYVTWGLFMMMMPLKRNVIESRLNLAGKILGYPWLVIMILADFSYNVTWGSVLFLMYPQDLLFTGRLDRMLGGRGWRRRLAGFFCRSLLDPYDPSGEHCKT